jgi:hypothetical protein
VQAWFSKKAGYSLRIDSDQYWQFTLSQLKSRAGRKHHLLHAAGFTTSKTRQFYEKPDVHQSEVASGRMTKGNA